MTSRLFLLSFLCLPVFIQPAVAQTDKGSNFDVELGGYAKIYTGVTEQDTASGVDVRSVDILRSTEIHFNAETKLDNGTKVGAHIEGQADKGDDFTADETYFYSSGDWGRIDLGGRDGPTYLLQVAAPSADKDVDGVRQQITPVNFAAMGLNVGETDYDQNISGKSDKIIYTTPLYSGLQFAASYTPELDPSRGANGNSLDDDDAGATSDIWDVAVRYQTGLGDINITTGAGYTQASRETGSGDDRQAWNAGLVLGYKKFSIGATYQLDDEGSADDDTSYLVIGMNYKIDKFTLGASYYHKDDNVGTEIDTDRVTAGVTYSWLPGIQFRSSVSQYNVDVRNSDNFDATSFVAGTVIDF